MRIPSGKTDQKVAFVAVDATDLKTRETGLSSFTVYRSRNGGTATIFTTPTVAELDVTNMPGVYVLTVDEDTTVAAGSDSEEMVLHITHAGMAPVTRVVELYRRDTTSGQTIDVSSGGVEVATFQAGAITAAAIATDAIDADALAADAVAELQSGLATAAALNTVDDLLDTEVAAIKTVVDAIEVDTQDIQGRLPAALVSGRIDASVGAMAANVMTAAAAAADLTTELQSGLATAASIAALNNLSAAQVNTEVDTALADYDGPTHAELTAGLAAADDAVLAAVAAVSTKVDVVDDLLDTEVAAIKTVVDAILVDTGTDIPTTLDALPTNAELATALGAADDAVLAAIAALNNLSAAGVRSAVGLASANLDTQLDALPTNAELATALGTADDAVLAAISGLTSLDAAGIRAAVGLAAANLDTQLDALPTNAELATSQAAADDATLAAIAALNNLSAAQVNAEVDTALVDVGLTTVVTGRIDAAISSRLAAASYTAPDNVGIADLPTNAELATALAAADDAVLAAIAALNNLSIANVRTAVGLASANLDTQLDALPTNPELATALAAADDAVLAAIAALTVPSANQNADALLDRAAGVETNRTLRQALRLMLAALAGKASGLATTTAIYRDTNDSVNRITATVDEDGNRSAVTLNAA